MWERLQLLLQQGKSILLTTHFMDEAERLCSRLLVLDHGKKIAEGTPRDLIAQHLEPDVVEVYGVGAVALMDSPAAGSLAARVELSGETVFFYTQDARPLLDALAASRSCAPCTGRPIWKTCSSSSPGAKSGRMAMTAMNLDMENASAAIRQNVWRPRAVAAVLAGVFAQPAGLAQAGHSQPGGQHCRAADVAGGLRLRHGRAGGAGDCGQLASSTGQGALHPVPGQRLDLHERHERSFVRGACTRRFRACMCKRPGTAS
jgi:hypothetical protein